jgi:hypothetical protein
MTALFAGGILVLSNRIICRNNDQQKRLASKIPISGVNNTHEEAN